MRPQVAVEESAQRNSGESPSRYDGFGPRIGVVLARETRSTTVEGSVAFGWSRLRSPTTAGVSRQRSQQVEAHLLYHIGSYDQFDFLAGAGGRWRRQLNLHQFAAVGAGDDNFGFLLAGIGPSIETKYRLRRDRLLIADISAPLASWADLPTTNTQSSTRRPGLANMTFVPLSRLLSLNGSLSYRTGAPTERSLVLSYGISRTRYVIDDARVFASQHFGAGLSVPF